MAKETKVSDNVVQFKKTASTVKKSFSEADLTAIGSAFAQFMDQHGGWLEMFFGAWTQAIARDCLENVRTKAELPNQTPEFYQGMATAISLLPAEINALIEKSQAARAEVEVGQSAMLPISPGLRTNSF